MAGFDSGGGGAASIPAAVLPFAQMRSGEWYSVDGLTNQSGAGLGEATLTAMATIPGAAASIDQLAVGISGAGLMGAVVRLGLYRLTTTPSASNNAATLLVDAGTVDGTVAGVASLSFAPVRVSQYDILLPVAVCQGGAASRPSFSNRLNSPFFNKMNTFKNVNPINSFYMANGIAGALPATVSGFGVQTNSSPNVLIHCL